MSVIALISAQWGDEGADRLAMQASIVARYNGDDNAGHSITIGDTLVRTHLVPAGAFYPHITCTHLVRGWLSISSHSRLKLINSESMALISALIV